MKAGRERSTDLRAVAVLAILGALVALISLPVWAQAVLLGPLALALPGYAIAAALFPPGAVQRGDRFVYAFVFSVSAAVLGMLVLQLVIDVHRTAWVCLLLAITLASAAIAWRRRRGLPIPAARPAARPPGGAVWILACLAAVGLAFGAIALASEGVRKQQAQQAFASLWAVPTGGPKSDKPVRVGVFNHGGPASFRLEVKIEDEPVASIPVRLGDRQEWRQTLPPPVTSSSPSLNVALVSRSERYRTVELNIQKED